MSSDRDGNRSNPYRPDPAQCCEACVFGSGVHAEWCDTFAYPCLCGHTFLVSKSIYGWRFPHFRCLVCLNTYSLVCPDPITIQLVQYGDQAPKALRASEQK
jgi:hypothetical protein